MLEVAVLYRCDLSQVFTPIILRLYQPHSLCEKAALVVFLLPPLREGRPVGFKLFYCPINHFYSRPYVRGDKRRVDPGDDLRQISTPAPT